MRLNTVEFLPKREEFSETLSQKKKEKKKIKEREEFLAMSILLKSLGWNDSLYL